MSEITSPISILEYGSTHRRIAIYDNVVLNQSLFFEEKIDFTRNQNINEEQIITDLISKAEKNLGVHLNEIILMIDSASIYSLDYSMQKNYEKKIITNNDIDYLINECETEIKLKNKDKDILHITTNNILLDGKEVRNLKKISIEASKIIIDLKFILISKKICTYLKNLFLQKHILVKNIFCTSYIKSLGLIKKLEISGYSSFIDIGLKKSSLLIFKDEQLLFIKNTHIGGDHITRDISKILDIDYRAAEAKKLKFYKNSRLEDFLNEDGLLKKVINSRLEEIVEILFMNCPIINNNSFNSDLRLFFIGNGSRVLNKNLLSFGPEFDFINEMTIIDEKTNDCCKSAVEFNYENEKTDLPKPSVILENKGFFEKLFEYFARN